MFPSSNASGYQNGHDLADTAIRAIESGTMQTSANPSKSTLIIHSVQRVSKFCSVLIGILKKP